MQYDELVFIKNSACDNKFTYFALVQMVHYVLGLDNVWIYFGLWLSYVGSAGPSDVSVVQINNECSNVGSGIVWLIISKICWLKFMRCFR